MMHERGHARRGWGGTLVVSPTPIHGQWLAELAAHSALKVEVYYGLQWHRRESDAAKRGRVRGFEVFSMWIDSLLAHHNMKEEVYSEAGAAHATSGTAVEHAVKTSARFCRE